VTRRHLSAVPDNPPIGPFRNAAGNYLESGWAPIPLPAGKKYPPEEGWTGGGKTHSGETPSLDQVAIWSRDKGDGNIAIRLPKYVIGIDVDLYDGKAGENTLAKAIEAWGELPDTWWSTSRNDGSGTRWYRIPEGLAWPGELPQGKGVELIRWDHRYAVVFPSIHPNGDMYGWRNPAGEDTLEADGTWDHPLASDLPELPVKWVEGLTGGKKWEPRAQADMDPQSVKDWLTDRGDDPMCPVMERTLQGWLQKIRVAGVDGGAHEDMLHGIWALIGDSAAGHKGIRPALERAMAAFKEAVAGRRSKAEASSEWRRAVAEGVRKVAAEGEPEAEDICELDETSRVAKTRRKGSGEFDYARNDSGNARRFATRYRDSVRYVPEFQSWFIWADRTWRLDLTGEITRMALATIAAIEDEVGFLEEEKDRAKLRTFISASSNIGKLEAMLKLARDLKGMTVPADQFDADRHQLVCSNGTLVLPTAGGAARVVQLKPSLQEHHNTIETGVAFERDASSLEWQRYLERFHPDSDVREWLQKLAGYSLLGANPRRLMIVAYGPTSTGKTTFATAMQKALGGYAGVTSMTIFRDNQDERPRPDLVKVLPKRMVYAEEASASWRLHPDQIKRVTGGAPISARVPYAKTYMDVVPAFTPWLLTNNAPTIEGADEALWRRLLVVPFFNQIAEEEEDDGYEDRLLSPLGVSAILAWLVRGYEMYLEDPSSLQKIPVGAIAATMEFRSQVSDFAEAMAQLCELSPENQELPSKLYEAYVMWCDEHHIAERDRLSGTKFGRELNGLGYGKKSVRIDGKTTWVRTGLQLKKGWVKAIGG
jgi:Zierdtviridae DNA primase